MPLTPFKDVIGHESVLSVLSKMIDSGKVPHAFLFVGPHKVGKTHVVNRLIQILFDNKLFREANPDFMEITCLTDEKTGKRKSNISVEQIRDLCERLSMSAFNGGWKIAFVHDADKLSTSASNALLKTLEEPKGKTLLILRAPSVESVLPTIASRCQILRFHPVEKETLIKGLMKKGFDSDDARFASAFALGRPGAAIRYLTKSEDRAEADIAVSLALELFNASIPKRISLIAKRLPKEDQNKREVADLLLKQWQGILRDVLFQKIGCGDLIIHEKQKKETALFGQRLDEQTLLETLSRAEEGRIAIRHNTNPQLTLEHIILSI